MKTIVFHLKGISPLLMHSTKGMKDGRTAKGVSTKQIPSAKDEAEAGAYRDDEGLLYIPCIFLKQAMISSGKGRKIGKHFATVVLKSGLIDPDRRARLANPATGELLADYDIDQRPVVIGKSRVMRARPRIEDWAADVALDYDETLFEETDILEEVANMAGSRIGVGDYRVEKGGWFGRFECIGHTVEEG